MAEALVPADYGEAEYVDRKSRFIGQVTRAATEAEAMEFVQSVRRKYPDATHNVWAYITKDGAMRWSDDGEPGGTSGQPTLNVFRSAGISEVCCVVTRYFGGILLGSGGLVRAYSKAASLALEASGLARMLPWTLVSVSCGYAQYERVRRLLEDLGAEGIEGSFTESVGITARLPEDSFELFASRLADVTAAQASCRALGTAFFPSKL